MRNQTAWTVSVAAETSPNGAEHPAPSSAGFPNHPRIFAFRALFVYWTYITGQLRADALQ